MKRNLFFILFMVLTAGFSVFIAPVHSQETSYFEKLVPLYDVKKDPGPTDWMATQSEQGQSFSQYIASQPFVPTQQRPYIYIALLGEFSQEQKDILQKTKRYLEIYFQTPVKFSEPISLSSIPPEARRIHPQTADAQILTTYVLENILKAQMPKDAFCFIAFTASDLWPGEGWNFVFGQASIEDRVGVWSIYRNGDLSKEPKLYLRRTIQTATHEIGHLFGLHHCIYYECNMNGSNSRHESDARPLWDCPVCLRKLSQANKIDIVKRLRQLIEISREYGFDREEKFFKDNLQTLGKQ